MMYLLQYSISNDSIVDVWFGKWTIRFDFDLLKHQGIFLSQERTSDLPVLCFPYTLKDLGCYIIYLCHPHVFRESQIALWIVPFILKTEALVLLPPLFTLLQGTGCRCFVSVGVRNEMPGLWHDTWTQPTQIPLVSRSSCLAASYISRKNIIL